MQVRQLQPGEFPWPEMMEDSGKTLFSVQLSIAIRDRRKAQPWSPAATSRARFASLCHHWLLVHVPPARKGQGAAQPAAGLIHPLQPTPGRRQKSCLALRRHSRYAPAMSLPTIEAFVDHGRVPPTDATGPLDAEESAWSA